jgi:hypothetical protein
MGLFSLEFLALLLIVCELYQTYLLLNAGRKLVQIIPRGKLKYFIFLALWEFVRILGLT